MFFNSSLSKIKKHKVALDITEKNVRNIKWGSQLTAQSKIPTQFYFVELHKTKKVKKKQFVVFLYLYYNVTKLGQQSRPWIQNLNKTKYYLHNFNLAIDAQHQFCQLQNCKSKY